MNVINLTKQSSIYTSNAWLCGCIHSPEDFGILIDTGCDPVILDYLRQMREKTGKNPVEKLILTHSHYDHAKLLGRIKEEFNPVVYAASSYLAGVDTVLSHGDVVKCGIYHFEIITIPGHTSDSVCIYCPEEEILFSGDTPLIIWGTENTYEKDFLQGFEELAQRKITSAYPGHGEIMSIEVSRMIRQSLINLKRSRIL